MRALLRVWALSILVNAAVAQSGDIYALNNPFPSGGEIRMDICSSGSVIRGSEDHQIRVRYGRRSAGKDVRIKFKADGNRGELKIDGCPRNNFDITIEVPKETSLYVRMWAGQLDVERVAGNKDLEIHAGQLNVDVGNPEDYGLVDGSVNSGEVDAPAFKVSKGGLFRSFHQNGPGKYRLHAHVGAGQVELN